MLSPKNGNFPNRYLRRGSIQKISIITDFFLFIFIVVDTDNNPFRSTFGVHRNTRHIIEGVQSFFAPSFSSGAGFRATQKALLRQPPQSEVKLQKKSICKYLIKMSWKFVHTNIAAQHRSQQCVRNNENDESAIIPNMMMNSTKIYFYGHIQSSFFSPFSHHRSFAWTFLCFF